MLHVFNVVGVLVYTQQIVSPDQTIQIKGVTAGEYVFRLTKNEKIKTVKVIKN